jgi:uncharacterized protein involved in response to NO
MPDSFFTAPIWRAAFRPFFLIGALYGPLILLHWVLAYSGVTHKSYPYANLISWHFHEMIYGYVMAIICGFVLTALPSWAGTREINGVKLAILVCAWFIGRFAFWFPQYVSAQATLICDQLLVTLLIIFAGPGVLKAKKPAFLLFFPLFFGFLIANWFIYSGSVFDIYERLQIGIELSVYMLIAVFILIGGFLTGIFTSNVVEDGGINCIPFPSFSFEVTALASIIVLAIFDIGNLPANWVAAAAGFAALVHFIRMALWKGYAAGNKPLIWSLNLSYCWLIIALVMKALGELQLIGSSNTWVHAFTIGALGLKQISLMTRVALRHTGRPLIPHKLMVSAFIIIIVAAVTRISVSLFELNHAVLILSAILWSVPFLLYAGLYGRILLSPSLPRDKSLAHEHA